MKELLERAYRQEDSLEWLESQRFYLAMSDHWTPVDYEFDSLLGKAIKYIQENGVPIEVEISCNIMSNEE